MKSIHSKFTVLMLIALMVCTLIIGGISAKTAQQMINRDSVQLMSFLCEKEAQNINRTFHSIEQVLDILAAHALEEIEDPDKLLNDNEYLDSYIQKIGNFANTIALKSTGAVSIYMRFNTDYYPSATGFFKVINYETDNFESVTASDANAYNTHNANQIDLYSSYKNILVNEKQPVWTKPYYNENLDANLISYLIPMYIDDMMIGVVGMDIDYTFLKETVDKLSLYYTGYAYLVDTEYKTVHNKKYPDEVVDFEYFESLTVARDLEENGYDTLYGYSINGMDHRVAFYELSNGMMLAVSAPLREIELTNYKLLTNILISSLIIALIFWVISSYLAKTIVQPLKKLTSAAKEVAEGNLDVSIVCESNDEVGTLSRSLNETVNELKKRIDYINSLAYIDKLTGSKNNTSYLYEIANINEELKKGSMNLGVFLVDVNGLKHVNDEYGHAYGNKIIIEVSKALINTFGQDNVYRIGGDEFIVLLKNTNTEICQKLEDKFIKEINNTSDDIKISAAIGYMMYDETIDTDYESLFNRADQEMYRRKIEMKESGEISDIL